MSVCEDLCISVHSGRGPSVIKRYVNSRLLECKTEIDEGLDAADFQQMSCREECSSAILCQ